MDERQANVDRLTKEIPVTGPQAAFVQTTLKKHLHPAIYNFLAVQGLTYSSENKPYKPGMLGEYMPLRRHIYLWPHKGEITEGTIIHETGHALDFILGPYFHVLATGEKFRPPKPKLIGEFDAGQHVVDQMEANVARIGMKGEGIGKYAAAISVQYPPIFDLWAKGAKPLVDVVEKEGKLLTDTVDEVVEKKGFGNKIKAIGKVTKRSIDLYKKTKEAAKARTAVSGYGGTAAIENFAEMFRAWHGLLDTPDKRVKDHIIDKAVPEEFSKLMSSIISMLEEKKVTKLEGWKPFTESREPVGFRRDVFGNISGIYSELTPEPLSTKGLIKKPIRKIIAQHKEALSRIGVIPAFRYQSTPDVLEKSYRGGLYFAPGSPDTRYFSPSNRSALGGSHLFRRFINIKSSNITTSSMFEGTALTRSLLKKLYPNREHDLLGEDSKLVRAYDDAIKGNRSSKELRSRLAGLSADDEFYSYYTKEVEYQERRYKRGYKRIERYLRALGTSKEEAKAYVEWHKTYTDDFTHLPGRITSLLAKRAGHDAVLSEGELFVLNPDILSEHMPLSTKRIAKSYQKKIGIIPEAGLVKKPIAEVIAKHKEGISFGTPMLKPHDIPGWMPPNLDPIRHPAYKTLQKYVPQTLLDAVFKTGTEIETFPDLKSKHGYPVRGLYVARLNRIRLHPKADAETIVHEFFHAVDYTLLGQEFGGPNLPRSMWDPGILSDFESEYYVTGYAQKNSREMFAEAGRIISGVPAGKRKPGSRFNVLGEIQQLHPNTYKILSTFYPEIAAQEDDSGHWSEEFAQQLEERSSRDHLELLEAAAGNKLDKNTYLGPGKTDHDKLVAKGISKDLGIEDSNDEWLNKSIADEDSKGYTGPAKKVARPNFVKRDLSDRDALKDVFSTIEHDVKTRERQGSGWKQVAMAGAILGSIGAISAGRMVQSKDRNQKGRPYNSTRSVQKNGIFG